MQGAFPVGPVWASCAGTQVVVTVSLLPSLHWRGSYHPDQYSTGRTWKEAAAGREIIGSIPRMLPEISPFAIPYSTLPFPEAKRVELHIPRQPYYRGKRGSLGRGVAMWQRSPVARLSIYRRLWGVAVVHLLLLSERALAAQTRSPGFNSQWLPAFQFPLFLPHIISSWGVLIKAIPNVVLCSTCEWVVLHSPCCSICKQEWSTDQIYVDTETGYQSSYTVSLYLFPPSLLYPHYHHLFPQSLPYFRNSYIPPWGMVVLEQA